MIKLYWIGDIMEDKTTSFDISKITEEKIKETLEYVIEALEERGYNAIDQMVGYIISGDLGYISSYKEARNRISKMDRTLLVEELLKNYLK